MGQQASQRQRPRLKEWLANDPRLDDSAELTYASADARACRRSTSSRNKGRRRTRCPTTQHHEDINRYGRLHRGVQGGVDVGLLD
ncbi:MAG: hypothetical protein ACLUE1_05120 [Adlercreutzia equolifaciens]